MAPLLAAGLLALLLVVLALVIGGLGRILDHWRKFGWRRHEKVLLSQGLPRFKSGDIVLFVCHATGLTNSLVADDLYTHGGMVVMAGGAPYLSEMTITMPQLSPRGEAVIATPCSSVLVPLVPRLEFYSGASFWMPLERPLAPAQEARLLARAQEKVPYPGVAQVFPTLFGSAAPAARHCIQHLAWLLDEMGMPPVSAPPAGLLSKVGFFRTRAVTGLGASGERLVGGNCYHEPLEILVDTRLAELPAVAEKDASL